MIAVVRSDLSIPTGKAAAQVLQGGIIAFHRSPPEMRDSYLADGEGTQLVLAAPGEEELLRALLAAGAAGIPRAEVPGEGGLLGFVMGPVSREVARPITKRLKSL